MHVAADRVRHHADHGREGRNPSRRRPSCGRVSLQFGEQPSVRSRMTRSSLAYRMTPDPDLSYLPPARQLAHQVNGEDGAYLPVLAAKGATNPLWRLA